MWIDIEEGALVIAEVARCPAAQWIGTARNKALERSLESLCSRPGIGGEPSQELVAADGIVSRYSIEKAHAAAR